MQRSSQASLKATLITGRTLDQGRTLEIGKFSKEYMSKVAIIELSKQDMEKLGISSGSAVKVSSAYGQVVVKAVESAFTPQGMAFIPMGPWANAIVSPNTQGSGMPTLKGIEVTIEKSEDHVLSLADFLHSYYGKKPFVDEVLSESQHNSSEQGTTTHKCVVCPFCGCLCDDLEVTVGSGRIVSIRYGCAIAEAKFVKHEEFRLTKPFIRRGEKPVFVSVDEAIEEAARILVNAKYPLLYGWSSTSVEAMRLGIELTELLGGLIDLTTVTCHGPSIEALQEIGLVSATLGQIKNRADVVVYWGSNPAQAHIRHMQRYTVLSKGVYRKTRKDRKLIVVDCRPTHTAKMADLFIQVEPNKDYELLTALRMIVNGYDIDCDVVAGVPKEKVYQLANTLMDAKFGVIYFGMGLTMTQGKSRNIEEAIKLVQDLNKWTKFVITPMRGHFNVTGAGEALTWITGFPFSVDFRRGFPRHSPGLTSATDALAKGFVDAALIIASDPVAHFPQQAVRHLAKIPLIVIDPKLSATASLADVFIPAAAVGVEQEGTAYRMDHVPLRLKKLIDPPQGVLSDEEILERLLAKVKKFKGVSAGVKDLE